MNNKRFPLFLQYFSCLIVLSILLSGCILFAGAGNNLQVSIDPSFGPHGTPATVRVTGAQPGDAILIKYSDGRSAVAGVADANGEFVLQDTFYGNEGDVIQLEVSASSGADERTASASFTITAPSEIESSINAPGNLQAAGGSPTISVNPDKGPTGTQATITIRGAGPNQPVTITHSGGSYAAQTDENGICVVQDTFTGQIGDVITIDAVIGAANEHQVSTTFTITAPPDQACTGTGCEDPLQDQGQGPTISVDPNKGPTGTTATITITGGTPGDAVTLYLDPGTTTGVIDANGNFTYTHTFYGQVGEIIQIEADIGPQNNHHVTTTFEITGPLEQVFNCVSGVFTDPLNHVIHIELPEVDLFLHVIPGSIVVEGSAPFVNVTGELREDGSFTATGTGTVAGNPEIAVLFDGTVSMSHLEGQYTMGAEGGLPGGLPITYIIQGEPDELEAEIAGSDRVADFFDTFNMAQKNEDATTMAALLHPAVIELYGADSCDAYLGSIVNPSVEIEVLEVRSFGPWDWVIDGYTTRVGDAFAVDVTVHSDQPDSDQRIHIAQRPDGSLGWFTDCGDPK